MENNLHTLSEINAIFKYADDTTLLAQSTLILISLRNFSILKFVQMLMS